jgi:hypothetical protein
VSASFNRGQCVQFVLSSGERIRGQIVLPGRGPGAWIILGTDAELYEQPNASLQHIAGKLARSTLQVTKSLLMRRDIKREIVIRTKGPELYVPKRRVEPDRKRRYGGYDGMPGYGERAEPMRLNADGQPIRPPPRSFPSEIPYELHKRDEWAGEGYGCGLEWAPQFERYINWKSAPDCNALADMDRQDPSMRLKLVYILCVQQERKASDVAAELGVTRMTIWRLKEEAERIMDNRRKQKSA